MLRKIGLKCPRCGGSLCAQTDVFGQIVCTGRCRWHGDEDTLARFAGEQMAEKGMRKVFHRQKGDRR